MIILQKNVRFIPFLIPKKDPDNKLFKKGLTSYQQQIDTDHGKEEQTAGKEISEKIAVKRN
jgi:hypothetical protein